MIRRGGARPISTHNLHRVNRVHDDRVGRRQTFDVRIDGDVALKNFADVALVDFGIESAVIAIRLRLDLHSHEHVVLIRSHYATPTFVNRPTANPKTKISGIAIMTATTMSSMVIGTAPACRRRWR